MVSFWKQRLEGMSGAGSGTKASKQYTFDESPLFHRVLYQPNYCLEVVPELYDVDIKKVGIYVYDIIEGIALKNKIQVKGNSYTSLTLEPQDKLYSKLNPINLYDINNLKVFGITNSVELKDITETHTNVICHFIASFQMLYRMRGVRTLYTNMFAIKDSPEKTKYIEKLLGKDIRTFSLDEHAVLVQRALELADASSETPLKEDTHKELYACFRKLLNIKYPGEEKRQQDANETFQFLQNILFLNTAIQYSFKNKVGNPVSETSNIINIEKKTDPTAPITMQNLWDASNTGKTFFRHNNNDYLIIGDQRLSTDSKTKLTYTITDFSNINVTIGNIDDKTVTPDETKYTLKGVILHAGTTAKSGHYYYIHRVNNSDDDRSYIIFNDTSVSTIKVADAKKDIGEKGVLFLYVLEEKWKDHGMSISLPVAAKGGSHSRRKTRRSKRT